MAFTTRFEEIRRHFLQLHRALKPHLEYVHRWIRPNWRKDVLEIDGVPQRFTRLISGHERGIKQI